MNPPLRPPKLKGPKQVHSLYPSLEELKPEGEDYSEKPEQESLRVTGQLTKIKTNKRARGPLAPPLTGDPKPFAQEWLKWSGSGKDKFPGVLDTGAP